MQASAARDATAAGPIPQGSGGSTTTTTTTTEAAPRTDPPGEDMTRGTSSSMFGRPVDGPRANLFQPFEGGDPKRKTIREVLDLPAEGLSSSSGAEGLRPQTRSSGALAGSSQQMGRRGLGDDADISISDCPSTPLQDAASIRRGPRLRHGRLTSSRTVGLDNHSVHGQGGRWGRGWAGTVGLWFSARLLLVSLLALSSALTGVADQIEYFGAADLAHFVAVAVSGCFALVSSCGVVLIVCAQGCGQVRQARRDDEEAWIEVAHRDRELPPLSPVVDDQAGDDDGDRAWREFVQDEQHLRRYVQGLEERIGRQRDGDVSRFVGVGASTAGGGDRAIRRGSMVTIPLSLNSGGAGRGEAEAGVVRAGTDAPRRYTSMLRDGFKRAVFRGKGREREGKGSHDQTSLSQRNLLRATAPETGTESRFEEDNLHSLPPLVRTSFLPGASTYWVWSGEEEAGPSGRPQPPRPLDAGDDVDDRFSIGSSGVSSVESPPEDTGKGKDKGKGKAL